MNDHSDETDRESLDKLEEFERKVGALQLKQKEVKTLDEVEAENTALMGKDRSTIAIVIIVVYALVILGALAYVVGKGGFAIDQQCLKAQHCNVVELWSTLTDKIISLITTAVLPIVTLMLGFYFGTETAAKSQSSVPPK